MASTYVHLNKRFYCTMNEYNGETYVHIRHRYDTSKRLSMRYAEMLEVIDECKLSLSSLLTGGGSLLLLPPLFWRLIG